MLENKTSKKDKNYIITWLDLDDQMNPVEVKYELEKHEKHKQTINQSNKAQVNKQTNQTNNQNKQSKQTIKQTSNITGLSPAETLCPATVKQTNNTNKEE